MAGLVSSRTFPSATPSFCRGPWYARTLESNVMIAFWGVGFPSKPSYSTIVPEGVPEGAPTDVVLKSLGRHGERPAHIHYFVSAPGHQHLTTQINLAGDPYTFDDFAFATREELVVPAERIEDPAEIAKRELDGPFAQVVFDVELAQTDAAELQVRHARPRAKEDEQDLASQLAGTAKV